jgi:hypothetical protein
LLSVAEVVLVKMLVVVVEGVAFSLTPHIV